MLYSLLFYLCILLWHEMKSKLKRKCTHFIVYINVIQVFSQLQIHYDQCFQSASYSTGVCGFMILYSMNIQLHIVIKKLH